MLTSVTSVCVRVHLDTGGGLTPAMMAAITVPSIVVGILIIIGIVVLCLWCNKRRKRRQMEKKRITA